VGVLFVRIPAEAVDDGRDEATGKAVKGNLKLCRCGEE